MNLKELENTLPCSNSGKYRHAEKTVQQQMQDLQLVCMALDHRIGETWLSQDKID